MDISNSAGTIHSPAGPLHSRARLFLLILTGLLPLLVIPGWGDPFTAPKWIAAALWIIVPVFSLFPETAGEIRRIKWPATLFILASTVATLVSGNSIWNLILSLSCLTIVLAWFSGGAILAGDSRPQNLATVLTTSGFLVSAIALLQISGMIYIRHDPFSPFATLGHRNFTGEYLILVIPFSVFLGIRGSSGILRIFGWGAAMTQILALAGTFNRGSWIGLIGGTATLCVFSIIQKQKKQLDFRSVMITLLVFFLIVVAAVPLLRERLISSFNPSHDTTQVRFMIWRSTWNMILDHPTGVGPGCFQMMYPVYRSPEETLLSGPDVFVNHAHNEILQMLAETGPAGLAAWIWIMWLAGRAVYRNLIQGNEISSCSMVSMTAVAAAAMTGNALRNPVSLLLFALIAGFETGTRHRLQSSGMQPLPLRLSGFRFIISLVFLSGSMVFVFQQILLGKAGRLEISNEYQQAARKYELASRIWPGGYLAAYRAGFNWIQSGHPDQAIRALKESLLRNPNFRNSHYNLGIAYEKTSQLESAAVFYREALRIDPTHAESWNNLGTVLARVNQPEEALKSFREAVRYNPLLPDTYFNMGIIYFSQSRLGEAENAWIDALGSARSLRFDRSMLRHLSMFGGMKFRGSHADADGLCDMASKPWGSVQFRTDPADGPAILNPGSGCRLIYCKTDLSITLEFDSEPPARRYCVEYELRKIRSVDTFTPNLPLMSRIWYQLGLLHETRAETGKAESSYWNSLFFDPGHAGARTRLEIIRPGISLQK